MGNNENIGLEARRQNLSVVCQQMYKVALIELNDLLAQVVPVTPASPRSPSMIVNAWNRVKRSPPQTSPQTNVHALLEGIMNQIEALDTVLKSNKHGMENLLQVLAATKISSNDTLYSVQEAPADFTARKAEFSHKLAQVLAGSLAKLGSSGQFDMNDKNAAIVLQALIDLSDTHMTSLASKPLLNFMTENMNAVKTWDQVKLNDILANIETLGLHKMDDRVDNSGEHELFARLLSWRFEVNSPRTGLVQLGTVDDSQTSKMCELLKVLNQADIQINKENDDVSFALVFHEGSQVTPEQKQTAEKQLVALVQFMEGKEPEYSPEPRVSRVVSK